MKGNIHLLVLATVGGGILSQTARPVTYLLLGLFIAWIATLKKSLTWIVTLSVCFIFGFIYFTPQVPTNPSTIHHPLKGKIISPLIETESTISTTLKLEDRDEKAMVVYFKTADQPEEINYVRAHLKFGAECVINGEAGLPEGARNPGQFDYQDYLRNQHITVQISAESADQISCKGQSFLHNAFKARNAMISKVKKSMSPRAFGWASALVFGDTQYLPEETVEWFRDFSLSHILAISGLHVGLFLGGVYLILYRSGFTTVDQARRMVLFILPAYSFISGAAPPVLRACLMAVFLLFIMQWKIKVAATDVLAIVAMLLLVFNPAYFYNLGFQFSFIVTFSLLLSYPLLGNKNMWIASIMISFISQAVILPLQLHHFYEFNPLSLFANILLVPYFSFIIIPLLFLLVLLAFFIPTLTVTLSTITVAFHESFLNWIRGVSEPLNIQWVVGELPLEWILAYFAVLILMMINWVRKRLKKAFLFGVGTVVVLMCYSVKPYISSQGTVTMLDVGQGDSFVVELPHRKGILMIDAAGSPVFSSNPDRIADQIIEPFLKSRGIKKIDALLISHMDHDHSGSVDRLQQSFNVAEIYVSPYHAIDQPGVNVIDQGDTIVLDGYEFNVLHPRGDEQETNKNSVVIYTKLGGKSWLFTGDSTASIEEKILSNYPSLTTNVLKVGHHGSDSSTSAKWINSLAPDVALISSGVDNRYGHPHKEVVDRLLEKNVILFRTDLHGAVQYQFSKQTGTFSTFLPYNEENKKRLP
ncbi:DNA internalization-related competence protein ComEC/Rec2 [Halobacillus naozhouensis]|uniref:DNA internalization-related competence protein ComEC/Rec2 n=1 Tax=Halobacillus naozhouensis TaxID=554880 RepID=A0ABY8IXD3_9BACI|nr:DNA internalization-related competence protein ComEC/Rec2 [Halobacillus naozhouensis]WFT73311.1 DNA internalization-related competence protein ComEC/Rec2 [Halobacillus naozhouensis]